MPQEHGHQMKSLTVFSTILLAALSVKPMIAHASSFDCRKAAAPTDFVICSEPALQEANERLAEAWHSLRTQLNDAERKSLVREQATWMRTLASQCGLPQNGGPSVEAISRAKSCVLSGIQDRTDKLVRQGSDSGTEAAAVACDDRLSSAELTRLHQLIKRQPGTRLSDFADEDGSVNFVCRDERHQPDNFVFRPPAVCTACGRIYSIHREAGKDIFVESSDTGGNNGDNEEEIVFDLSGHPYVLLLKLYTHQGDYSAGYELIALDDGQRIDLAGVSGSMEGCAVEDEESSDRVERPEKILRKDGHYDIVFHISSTDCQTKETSTQTLRYVPTKRGFTQEQ